MSLGNPRNGKTRAYLDAIERENRNPGSIAMGGILLAGVAWIIQERRDDPNIIEGELVEQPRLQIPERLP